jgi:hypothetical protein
MGLRLNAGDVERSGEKRLGLLACEGRVWGWSSEGDVGYGGLLTAPDKGAGTRLSSGRFLRSTMVRYGGPRAEGWQAYSLVAEG